MKPLRFASGCSGVDAPTLAWSPLGWEPVFYSEIAPFASAVLEHRHPNTPNLGDLTKIFDNETFKGSTFDIWIGGTPCVGFSLAGKRNGMDDDRSKLAWDFLRVAELKRPRWIVWENVPDVMSSWSDAPDEGQGVQTNDFDQFLSALAQIGYGFAYRVLDAQFWGLAQRRKRIIVVGYLGDWRPPTAVLFEWSSLCRDPAPRRKKGKEIAPEIASSLVGTGAGVEYAGQRNGGDPVVAVGHDDYSPEIAGTMVKGGTSHSGFRHEHGLVTDDDVAFMADVAGTLGHSGKAAGTARNQDVDQGLLIAYGGNLTSGDGERDVATAVRAHKGSHVDFESETFVLDEGDVSKCLTATSRNRIDDETETFVFDTTQVTSPTNKSKLGDDLCHTMAANAHPPAIIRKKGVRRLTPRECERLMGFPAIIQNVKIIVCQNSPDNQTKNAIVETLNHKSQKPVGSAENCRLSEHAKYAEPRSIPNFQPTQGLAALNVLLDYEVGLISLDIQGKSKLSASIAGKESSFLPQILSADFVRLLADMLSIQEQITQTGKAGSHLKGRFFNKAENGNSAVVLFGQEIDELANDAQKFIIREGKHLRFTTSPVGQDFPTLERTLAIYASFVLSAINSSIPDEIKSGNFYELNLSTIQGFTQIPYRGKPAEKCPDGPRYQVCGNSMAVPLFRWLGERIDLVERIKKGDGNPPPQKIGALAK